MAKPVITESKLQNPSLDHEALIVKQAKESFQAATDHWNKFRSEASDCLKFINGEHLSQTYINIREAAGLPALVENRVPAFLHNLTSEMRQHIPSIQVDAANDTTDAKFAEQTSDLIRTIEQESSAHTAYTRGAWYAIGTGLGYARVLNEYKSQSSFEQRLIIQSVDDPATILLDPNHKAVDGSDSEFAFVVVDMSHNEYLRKYANSKVANIITNAQVHGWSRSVIKSGNQWLTKNTVRVAEYYVKEYFEKTLYLVFDREIGAQKILESKPTGNVELLDTRKSTYAVIKHYVLNDKEILDENEWPGQTIPIIAFKGVEFWNEGTRYLKGMVQDMRDPQRRIDYFLNWQASMVMLASTGQYIGTAKNFAENQHEWQNINVSNQAYITFVPDPLNGGTPPQRDLAEPPVQAAQALVNDAVEGLKAVTGMQAPMVGEQGNQPESGRALLSRIEQSHTTNFHYQDNIRRSIARIGQILVDAIPTFYSQNNRQEMLTRRDKTQYLATFNDQVSRMYDKAEFKVAIETGGAYSTKRQAAVDSGLEMIRAYPQAAPLIADLIVENMDTPLHQEIAARLRAAVPPNVLAATAEMDSQEGPQVIANLKNQLQGVQQELQKMQQEVLPDKTKIQKLELDNAFQKNDNTWEYHKAELDHKLEVAKLDFEQKRTILEAEIKRAELKLQEREIDLKEAEFKLEATKASANISSQVMSHHHKVNDAVNKAADALKEDVMPDKEATTGAEGDLGGQLELGTGENFSDLGKKIE